MSQELRLFQEFVTDLLPKFMPNAPLNDLVIRGLRCPDNQKQIDFHDSAFSPGCFGVRVYRTGRKKFFLVYRYGGRQRRILMEEYPKMSLAMARAEAIKAISSLKSSRDPKAQIDTISACPTFAQLSEHFLSNYTSVAKLSPRTVTEYERYILNHLNPHFGQQKVVHLSRRHFSNFLQARAKNTPAMARRLREILHLIFRYALNLELVESNPIADMVLKIPVGRRDRYLNEEELKKFLEIVSCEDETYKCLFLLLVLTGQRIGEVRSMRWQNLDLNGGIWTIPAEDSKNRKSHKVPLSNWAKEILVSRRRQQGLVSQHVFPGSNNKNLNWTKRAAARVRNLCGFDFVPHDLRRTTATWLAQEGADRETISRLLNHSSEVGVTAIYDRYDRFRQIAEALERWAVKLRALQNPIQKAVMMS